MTSAVVVSELNAQRWLRNDIYNVDAKHFTEHGVESDLIALAEEHGLALCDLLDVCWHHWYDMESEKDTLALWKKTPEEVAKFAPERWLLRSRWDVRRRAIDRQRSRFSAEDPTTHPPEAKG